jgi:hypothetical protein
VKWQPFCAAALLAAVYFTSPASATTLARLTLDQLSAEADAVARVRFVSGDSRWLDGSIWTITTFEVVESMKGNLPPRVAVWVPGGRVAHITAVVNGTPQFHPGDQAIVFLQVTRSGGFAVAGWVQGAFHIAVDPRTGREADSSSFPVFDPTTRKFRQEGVRRMPVEELRARIASGVSRSQGKSQ